MPSTGRTTSLQSISGCRSCVPAFGPARLPGSPAASARLSYYKTVDTLEHMDSGTYDAQPEAVVAGLPAAERSHARIIEALASGAPRALSGAALARLEGRAPWYGRQRAARRGARRQ